MSNGRGASGWAWMLVLLAGVAPLRGQQCREGQAPRSVLRGVVLDQETRVPLQGAEVRLEWQERGRERSHEVETDSLGHYRICDPPTGVLLNVRADFWGEGAVQGITVEEGDSAELALEAEAPASVLRGRVVHEQGGGGIADAQVRVLDSPLSTLTNASGEFTIPKIPPGKYRVQFEHLAFGTRTDTVSVDFRSTVELVAQVADRAIPLPPLQVSVRSQMLTDAGFYERQTAGFGQFLTRQEWERRSPRIPSDLLRMVPGVRVVPAAGGFDNVILDRTSCPVRYIMDGTHLTASFRLDEIPVEWIEALEVYRGPATVPAQFRAPPTSASSGCGVIVIWTRRAR